MRGPSDDHDDEGPPVPLSAGEQLARVLMIATPFILVAAVYLILRAWGT